MTLLLPIGLAALALAVPIVMVHMLTPRRPPTFVSSLLHWDGLKHSVTAAEPWQRLRWSLLFLLQMLAVILFALALAQPARVEQAELADHTVFIIDASGSMSAIDGSPDRIAVAVERAARLREEIPDNGAASVVVASPNPAVLLEEDQDRDAFARAIASIIPSAGAADFEAAFSLAESLRSADRPTGFVLVSDGGLDEIDQRLAPLGTRFEPIGQTDINRAITDLSVTAGPGGMQVRVTIESTGGPDAVQVLRLDVDGITVDSRELVIPEGEVVEETFEVPLGRKVAAFLDGQDLIAFDNQRYVAATVPGTLKVRVHGDSTFFLSELLSAIPQVDTEVAPGEEVDFEIYAGVAVPLAPEVPFIAVDAPGGAPGITPSGRVENPIPTLVTDDPVLADVDVSRIAIADAQVLDVAAGEVLLGAPGAPLLLRGTTNGVPFFYIAFTLEQSNLPVNIAFPIIGSRMVTELASAEGTAASLTVGERIPVGSGGGRATDPRGASRLIAPAELGPVADLAGFWVVERPDEEPLQLAVNADTGESKAKPVTVLPALRPAPEPESGTEELLTNDVARSVLPWVITVLLVILAFELLISRRHRGVPKRQWRFGVAVRAIIVALLALALIDPVFNGANDSVTTVFVVDTSASLGNATEEATGWVRSALTEAEDGRWAIVEVGAQARVAEPVGTDPYRAHADVDPTATNLARGLRLGESLLSGDSKERIVLVSDGRSNAGELSAEIDRLRSLGVVVDVHTIPGAHRTDAAVASIDTPSKVSEGESFDAVVEILSSVAAQGTVELLSEGVVTGTRSVALEPGSNLVAFTVDAEDAGLHHLTAKVAITGDAVRQNDETSTAVEVEGPPSVLLVEGEPGNGEIIQSALESKSLVVETTAIAELPGIQELSIHRAAILVNVSARDITDGQIATLDAFVRDLGRGLVVVGGDSSFALGGYRNTDLEALLPVDSEAHDPKREASVAEVLLIDTSESMGACHCSENEQGEFMDEQGGPNKTDIAKAASVRAIEVLGANDEVGVLAFAGSDRWVIPLQELPSRQVIDEGIGSLRPFGETRIVPALRTAAEALRGSNKELKHIILFTDGFTMELEIEDFGGPEGFEFGDLVSEAELLAAEGITVSVVGTGEGATSALERVAEAGGGRFYPGRDLNEIPEIFVKEARLASRSFINEGEFYPSVTSTAAAVRELGSSPALLGYVATTAKPTAEVALKVGELADPLLASWRVGLGKVTVWTSDGGDKWGGQWAEWDGFAGFWSTLVRDTFPLSGSAGQRVDASISGEVLTITLEGSDPWPPGTTPVVRVRSPDDTSTEVRMERKSDFEYEVIVPARQGGAYAVGVGIENAEGRAVILSAIASRSFAAEYLPGEADPELLASISQATGGRGEIAAAQAFDAESLAEGSRPISFLWLFLLVAALLWPLDVAVRRLRLSRRAQPAPPQQPAAPPSTPRTPAGEGTR